MNALSFFKYVLSFINYKPYTKHLIPYTIYQLPNTIYQIPVYPLDKSKAEKRLGGLLTKKSRGLLQYFVVAGWFQSTIQSVPGVWSNLDSGANPMAEMAVYAHIRLIINWRFDNSGKIMNCIIIELNPDNQKLSISLMISKKGRFEICQ